MKNHYRWMAVICTALLLQGCSSNSENGQAMRGQQPPPAVEAVQAQFGSLPLEERLSGTVRSGNQIAIYPRISAPVEEVFVENGEAVEAGDPLVRLEDRDYRERLQQAEASLRIAEAQARQAEVRLNELQSQLRRQRTLAERDLISASELESIEAQVAGAEADYDLAQAQVDQAQSTINERETELSRTVIRSPITGVVGVRNVEVGMQVDTGSRLFTVGDVTQSKVLVSLTESMLRYIQTGQTAKIFSESLGDSVIYGEVSRISPFLQEGSFSTQAEIDVPNSEGDLLPGMFVTVDIMYGESEQATLVPISAIYRHPRTGIEGIYTAPGFGSEMEPVTEVDSGDPPPLSEPTELEFKPVQVIAKGRESAGVVGVNSGDWILTVGQSLMVGRQENVARIRAVTWDRILSMQRAQPQDLLRQVLEEQEMARAQN
ncbi:MAG: efflux RND transporter periplasmic adaptor subunit [Balneolaceae bacterium]